MKSRVSLVLASLVISIVVCELAFRLLDIRAERFNQPFTTIIYSDTEQTYPYNLGHPPFSVIETAYSSDERGYFEEGNLIRHRHNSLGWRDIEHEEEKSEDTFRILGLGDSYLWGQGVRREDICLSKLREKLEAKGDKAKFETINSARTAINTSDQRDILKARGLKYKPDLIILHYVPNDVEKDILKQGPKIEFHTDYTALYLEPKWFSRYSRFADWIWQRYAKLVLAERFVSHSVASFNNDSPGWIESQQALLEIRSLAEESGAKLLVVVFPFFYKLNTSYPFAPINQAVRSFCEENNIPVLDLYESYRSFAGPELWVHGSDQHPNELAHEIAASSIARYLVENRQLFELPID